MRLTCLLTVILALSGAVGSAWSQNAAELVRTKLVADRTAIAPGDTFRLGVLYEMKPHWHIYWKNPGDAGKPTEIKLQLPQGLTAGELQWPVARQFKQAGDLVGYGYEGQVLLWTQVTVPKDVAPGSTVKLAARTDFLVCMESCIEGQADLELSLPVAEKPALDAALLDKWAEKLPARKSDRVKAVRVQGALGAGNTRGPFTVEIEWNNPPKELAFLPAVGAALDVSDIEIKTADGKTTVKFMAKLLRGKTLPESGTMESVLTFGDGTGLAIEVPLKTSEK